MGKKLARRNENLRVLQSEDRRKRHDLVKSKRFAAVFEQFTERNYFVTLQSGRASRSLSIASSETPVARKLTALRDLI